MTSKPPDSKSRFWRNAVLLVYPYLLSAYPILALRNHNITYVDLGSIFRSLVIVTAGTTILGLAIYLLCRSVEITGIIVSVLNLMLLSYGHLYNQIGEVTGDPIRHRYLIGVEGVILIGISGLILWRNQIAKALAQFLAAASIVLVGIVLFETLRYDVNLYSVGTAAAQNESLPLQTQGNEGLPDFYLFILDGHTRSDVVKDRFDYDNSKFIEQLEEMGFYVPKCSQSNYASTKLTLTSMMYGDYIRSFVGIGEVLPPLNGSSISRTLDSLGYVTIAFENRARGHFDLNEDIHLSRNQTAIGQLDLRGGINEFEKMMLDTSFVGFLASSKIIPGFDEKTIEDWELLEHYYQTEYILSELEKIPEMPGAKFVFTHIMVPHPPYIFTPDGSFQNNEDPIEGYRSNVEFIDNRLPSILQKLIEKSDPKPIIVIMGDHGPTTRKTITEKMRMAILSAYLVNDEARATLYPAITPVNATRVILNTHYGTHFDYLEDTSYYAYKASQLSRAEIINNDCRVVP